MGKQENQTHTWFPARQRNAQLCFFLQVTCLLLGTCLPAARSRSPRCSFSYIHPQAPRWQLIPIPQRGNHYQGVLKTTHVPGLLLPSSQDGKV